MNPIAVHGGTTTDHDDLFAPLTLGGLTVANRVAVAPMTRISAAPDGRAGDRMARYYARFAHGGFALIVTEGIYPDTEYSQGYRGQPGLATAEQERAWAGVVEGVHAEGGAMFAQLMHAGAQAQGNTYREATAGPSAVAPRGEQLDMYGGSGPYPVPLPLGRADLAGVRRGFTAAARRAADAGFDGVEIHGANGYLLDQFLTDYLNRRDDEYGGTTENRVRLAAEVCDAVLQEVGSDIVVGIRVSQSKVSDPEHRWAAGAADAETIFGTLRDTGIHFVHTAEYEATAPAFPTGPETLAELAKRHSGLTVIANGGLDDPATARSVLASGAADLVALGKAALANPDWPRRARSGQGMTTELPEGLLGPLADIKDWELEAG